MTPGGGPDAAESPARPGASGGPAATSRPQVPCRCERPRVVWNEATLPERQRRLWLRCMNCGRVAKSVDGAQADPELPKRARDAWHRRLTSAE